MRYRNCAPIALALGCALFLPSCKRGDTAGLAVGEAAPKIEAAGWVNGKAPTEAELQGKVVVVDAWASW